MIPLPRIAAALGLVMKRGREWRCGYRALAHVSVKRLGASPS